MKQKTKKTEREEFLSKNQGHAIKYRKRVQEDIETTKELKEYVKDENASKSLQDDVRGKYLP